MINNRKRKDMGYSEGQNRVYRKENYGPILRKIGSTNKEYSKNV